MKRKALSVLNPQCFSVLALSFCSSAETHAEKIYSKPLVWVHQSREVCFLYIYIFISTPFHYIVRAIPRRKVVNWITLQIQIENITISMNEKPHPFNTEKETLYFISSSLVFLKKKRYFIEEHQHIR